MTFLAPFGYTIRSAPYCIVFIGNQFSWFSCQKYIGLLRLFAAFFFNFCLSTLLRLIRDPLSVVLCGYAFFFFFFFFFLISLLNALQSLALSLYKWHELFHSCAACTGLAPLQGGP